MRKTGRAVADPDRDGKGGPEIGARQTILAAAWALVEATGFDALSVNAVLRGAGLSKGTFYHWFDGRDGLIAAMLDEVLTDATRRLGSELAGRVGTDAVSQLVGIVLAFRHYRIDNPAKTVMSHRFLADPRNSGLKAAIRKRGDETILPLLVETIRQGIAENMMVAADPEAAAELTLGFWHQVEDLQMDELHRSKRPSAKRLRARAGLALDWLERGLGLPTSALDPLRDALEDTIAQFVKG